MPHFPLWLPNHSEINSLPDEKETWGCSGSRFLTMVPFVLVQSGNRGGMEGMRRSPKAGLVTVRTRGPRCEGVEGVTGGAERQQKPCQVEGKG